MVVGIVMVASKSNENQSQNIPTQTAPKVFVAISAPNAEVATEEPKIKSTENSSINEKEKTNESDIDPAKAKGNSFEDFVINLLADWRLTLLDRTQDAVSSAGVVAESSKNPDLHVSQKRGSGSIDYYVECKFRSRWDDGKVQFEKWQIDRYRQFQRNEKRKVIIALGVGGSPSAPRTLMLVPIDSLRNNSVREIDTKYVVQPNSQAFIEYMNSYFTTVFKNAKSRKD